MRHKLLSHLLAGAVAFGAFAYAQPAAWARESGKRPPAPAASRAQASGRVTYKTVKIDELDIFYREAGSPATPTVLLLHGFPTSSHMFRNLLPRLADKYHVVAPDSPGYGQCSMPKVTEFNYTFDNLAKVIEKVADTIGLQQCSLYGQDIGAPVGFRLAAKIPNECRP